MIIHRKKYKVRNMDDTYMVDKEKGITRYKDPETGEYIESKIQKSTVNKRPTKKNPNSEKVETYFKSKESSSIKDKLIRNLVSHKNASNFR